MSGEPTKGAPAPMPTKAQPKKAYYEAWKAYDEARS